jgi:hypothetical protein
VVGQLLITLPTDVAGGIAHAKHGIEQQVELTAARPDNQVGARQGLAETVLGLIAQMVDTQQQGDADGQ